jgi:3-hydroxyacyl-[acyl-carrier-protein] dehydratase
MFFMHAGSRKKSGNGAVFMEWTTPLDVTKIQEIIPHRYPFLLVDRIVELEIGKRAVGVKNVTVNEPFFQGHFPGYPVMPGVLIVEALAQVGAVAVLSMEENKGKLGFFAGIDGFRFKEQVKPGDTLILEVEMTRVRGSVGKGRGTAKVNDKVVAEGELMFALVSVEKDPS